MYKGEGPLTRLPSLPTVRAPLGRNRDLGCRLHSAGISLVCPFLGIPGTDPSPVRICAVGLFAGVEPGPSSSSWPSRRAPTMRRAPGEGPHTLQQGPVRGRPGTLTAACSGGTRTCPPPVRLGIGLCHMRMHRSASKQKLLQQQQQQQQQQAHSQRVPQKIGGTGGGGQGFHAVKARQAFERVLALEPENVDALVALAVMDINSKQPQVRPGARQATLLSPPVSTPPPTPPPG